MKSEEIKNNIPRKEAVELIESLTPVMDFEEIGLLEACGRVAACDLVSRANMPVVPCSKWDGISFSYEQYESCAGDVSSWQPEKDYRFTNTGIPVGNERFDTMVMIEQCVFDENGALTAILQPDVEKGQNIVLPGSKMSIGEILTSAGSEITPSHMNLLASGLVETVSVYCRPSVGIIVTGNELVPFGQTCPPDRTVESNSVSMSAKVRNWGGIPHVYPIIEDSEKLIRTAVLKACGECDIVVIGGGSGRGQCDLLQNAVSGIGTLYFSSVEHGPAKRTSVAQVEGKPVIGLVGPPGGEEMSFDFYVLPAIRASMGQRWRPTVVSAVLDSDIPVHGRTDFLYSVSIYRDESGGLCAHPFPHADIDRNIATHDGYVFVKKSSSGMLKGQIVSVELRTGHEHY